MSILPYLITPVGKPSYDRVNEHDYRFLYEFEKAKRERVMRQPDPLITLITREYIHRCPIMVNVERRRNEDKAKKKGDRFYEIKWDAIDGWSLYNRGVKTDKRKRLDECPFCRLPLPFLNQVVIE